jgi:hypothetical protein
MLHSLFPQSVQHSDEDPKPMVPVGAALVKARHGTEFFRVKGLGTVKKWLRGWFYVKNRDSQVDLINLPDYQAGPPRARHTWEYYPADPQEELKGYYERILRLIEKKELNADDLVLTFISRRVMPLQRRAHKICHMSGRHDPTRTSTFALTKPDIQKKVKAICMTHLEEDWSWGLEPYRREKKAPAVSIYPDIFFRAALISPCAISRSFFSWYLGFLLVSQYLGFLLVSQYLGFLLVSLFSEVAPPEARRRRPDREEMGGRPRGVGHRGLRLCCQHAQTTQGRGPQEDQAHGQGPSPCHLGG